MFKIYEIMVWTMMVQILFAVAVISINAVNSLAITSTSALNLNSTATIFAIPTQPIDKGSIDDDTRQHEVNYLVQMANNGDIFFGALFGHVGYSIPIMLTIFVVCTLITHHLNERYRDAKIMAELKQYRNTLKNSSTSNINNNIAGISASAIDNDQQGAFDGQASSGRSPVGKSAKIGNSINSLTAFLSASKRQSKSTKAGDKYNVDLEAATDKLALGNMQIRYGPPIILEFFDPKITTQYGRSPVIKMPQNMFINFESDVKLTKKLAEGGGGAVYVAEIINEEVAERGNCRNVVVKVLKPTSKMTFTDLKAATFYEIAVMSRLMHHPNICKLVGFSEEPLSITTKRYDMSLFKLALSQPRYANLTKDYDYLREFIQNQSRLKGLLIKGFELLPEIALHLAWGIASGMAEMHRFNLLHRDLKSANILLEISPIFEGKQQPWVVDPTISPMASEISGLMQQNSLAGGLGWGKDENGKPLCPINAVLIDFGLAKIARKNTGEIHDPDSLPDNKSTGISFRYAAPEAFSRIYHQFQNVFSFGIICWEMLERKVPFYKLSSKEIEVKVKSGERPVISSEYRNPQSPLDGNRHYPVLVRCLKQCWKQDPNDRPTFEDLKMKLLPFWLGVKQPP